MIEFIPANQQQFPYLIEAQDIAHAETCRRHNRRTYTQADMPMLISLQRVGLLTPHQARSLRTLTQGIFQQ